MKMSLYQEILICKWTNPLKCCMFISRFKWEKNPRCVLRLLDRADYAKLSLHYHAGLKEGVELDIIFWSSSFLHDHTFTLHEPRTSIMSYNDLKPMSAKQFDFKSISSLEDVKCYQTYFLCSVWWGHSAWMNVRPDTVSSMTLLSYELNAVYISWATNGSKSQGFTAGFYQEQNSVSISDWERKKLDNWTVFSFVLLNVRLSDVFMAKVWSVGFLERVRLSWVSHSVCVCVCVCNWPCFHIRLMRSNHRTVSN